MSLPSIPSRDKGPPTRDTIAPMNNARVHAAKREDSPTAKHQPSEVTLVERDKGLTLHGKHQEATKHT